MSEDCTSLAENEGVIDQIKGFIQSALTQDEYQKLNDWVNLNNLISQAVYIYCMNTNGADLQLVDWGTTFRDLYSELKKDRFARNTQSALYILSQLDSVFAEPQSEMERLMKEYEPLLKKRKKSTRSMRNSTSKTRNLSQRVKELENKVEELYNKIMSDIDELKKIEESSGNIKNMEEFRKYMERLDKLENDYRRIKSMMDTITDNIINITEKLNEMRNTSLEKSLSEQLKHINSIISSLAMAIAKLPAILSHQYSQAEYLSNTIGKKLPYFPQPQTFIYEKFRNLKKLLLSGYPYGNFPMEIYPVYGILFSLRGNNLIANPPIKVYTLGGEACPGFMIVTPPYDHETLNRLEYYVMKGCGVEIPLFALGSVGNKIGEVMLEVASENNLSALFNDYTLGPSVSLADKIYNKLGNLALAPKDEYENRIQAYGKYVKEYGIPTIFVFCDEKDILHNMHLSAEKAKEQCKTYIVYMIKYLFKILVM